MTDLRQGESLCAYLGEDNTDVADEHLEEASPLVVAGPLDVVTQAALHHGVLTHEDDGLRAESLQGHKARKSIKGL